MVSKIVQFYWSHTEGEKELRRRNIKRETERDRENKKEPTTKRKEAVEKKASQLMKAPNTQQRGRINFTIVLGETL